MAAYDIRAFGRMWSSGRKEAMGLDPNAHLPEELPGTFVAHGITLYLEKKGAVKGYKRQRVRACCPVCHKVFAAGNLEQHHETHTDSGRAMLARKADRRRERVADIKARRGY